jgi:hypothetical protein
LFGPDIDRNRKQTLWADTYYSRLRTEVGCIVWGVLSVGFTIVGIVRHYPVWSLVVVLGGPLLLLLFVAKVPLADVPIPVVIVASLGGIGWEYAANGVPPWTIGLIFIVYLFAYEEALSGLAKVRYLQALAPRRYDLRHVQRCDEEHLVSKRRVWGYLLATSSSAVVVNGLDSGGPYHAVLGLLLVLTFLLRSRLFAGFLRLFGTTRSLGVALDEGRRWPHLAMALLNAVAYGVSMHWLVVHGNAFGAHLHLPWHGPATAGGDWFNDFETVGTAIVLWVAAIFRFEWTE